MQTTNTNQKQMGRAKRANLPLGIFALPNRNARSAILEIETMGHTVERSKEEIEELYGECMENPTKFPGMTYAQGIQEVIDWLDNDNANPPSPMAD